ncbi:MAG TPA: hypothetical protein DCQ93_08925 [Bacteroidetes bacterium]|nr:hypothetical protein [Bacteroidota bacterium]
MFRILFVVIILVAGAVVFGLYEYFKPNERTADLKADYTISAVDFYNYYSENEDSANLKYINKVIEVTGVVSDVSKKDTSSLLIILDGGNGMFGVSCGLQRTGENFVIPEKHSTLTIRGICVGMDMDIKLTRCSIVSQKNENE